MSATDVVKAITVTAELTGASMSGAAIAVMTQDLMVAYPEEAIIAALTRCRRELTRPLTAGAVFERLCENDGRPGIEEAWAMCPKTEADSVCWTLEMREAYSIARSLSDNGDSIGARMAFKDAYERLVRESRDNGFPTTWELSLGWDAGSRQKAVEKAVQVKAISSEAAAGYLPAPAGGMNLIEHLSTGAPLMLDAPGLTVEDVERVRERVSDLKRVLASRPKVSAERRAADSLAQREDLARRKAEVAEAVRVGLNNGDD